jgi:F-type H+-transporting ATPase subunit a
MFSPLEQFDVISLVLIFGNHIDISFVNIMLPLLIINILMYLLVKFFKFNVKLIPEIWQFFFESIFVFILNIIKQQIGSKGLVFFPLIFSMFIFILLCNLFSLIPFGIAITSHIIIVIYLSMTICISIFILGLLRYNLRFLQIFIPECPFVLLPILVPIEIFSYLIRMFSLAIRLAANILAGHTLVFIISGFVLNVTLMKFWFLLIGIIPLIAVLFLELGVAFLQAYVFTILICIYLADSLKDPQIH